MLQRRLLAILVLGLVAVWTAPPAMAESARTESVAKKSRKKARKARKKAHARKLGDHEYYVYDHLIVRGDTVGGLARKYRVSQEQIMVWNDLPSPHMIRAGETLTIYSKKRFRQSVRSSYRVKAGDTLGKIARRHKMSVAQLRTLNRIRGDLIHPGQDLVVLAPKAPEIAVIGGRKRGSFAPVQLTNGPGYHLKAPRNAWGTMGTIKQIKSAFRAHRKRYKRSTIAVGDISKKRGGPFPPHRSHQSGLDVDIGFYRKGVASDKRFYTVTRKTLDAKRTWALLDQFLRQGQIDMIFIDYGLQKPLYEAARRSARYSAKKLRTIFQYPRGKRARAGIIRHEPGHDDHIHVRFTPSPVRASSGRSVGARK